MAEFGDQRLIRAAARLRNPMLCNVNPGFVNAVAELLERVAPLAPYWGEPYAAPWVPVIESAVRISAAMDDWMGPEPDGNAETVASVSEAAGWIRDERDAALARLDAAHDLLDRLDDTSQDYDTDMIRAALGERGRPWADYTVGGDRG